MTSIDNPSGTEQLVFGASKLRVELTLAHLSSFVRLVAELRGWNERFNLTTVVDPAEILIKHVLDSLTVVPMLDHIAGGLPLRLADVGSGAGFPGLPIKIVRPQIDTVLVEASGKKVSFLQHVVDELGLEGTSVAQIRAEELARDPDQRESFDVAVGRAVAGVATLAELLLPLVRVGGYAILMKTRASLASEVVDGGRVWEELGAQLLEPVDVSVPGFLDDRVLLLAHKVEPITERFPRRAGIPQRRPLIRR